MSEATPDLVIGRLVDPAPQHDLVRVPFHDDLVEAVRTADGQILVSIRRDCENLGVDFSSQLAKLKKLPWAGVVMIATPGKDGVAQQLAMLPNDQRPMWFATINPRKTSAHVREKLALYQKEAAKVLAAHFLGSQAPPPQEELTPTQWALRISRDTTRALEGLERHETQMKLMAAQAAELDRQQLALKARQDQAEAKQEELRVQVQEILEVREEALRDITALPLCPTAAEPRTPRDCINEIVKSYALRTCSDPKRPDFAGAWNKLYREVYYRLGIDLKKRAENSNSKPLPVAEELGIIDKVWAIASEVLVGQPITRAPQLEGGVS